MNKTLRLVLVLASLAAASVYAQPAGGPGPGPGGGQQMQPGGPGGPGMGGPGGGGRGMGGGGARGGGRGRGVGLQPPAAGRVSPHETISANIANRVVSITYGRPYSKAPNSEEIRKIWGTLVPWGQPYRLGADEATILVTPVDLVFGGSVTIPAGAHTLYMMPVENGPSQLVFSKNIGKWGIPVDTASDIAKVDLVKSELTPANTQLTLAFENVPPPAPAEGTPPGPVNPTVRLKIMWEATQYAVTFQVKQ
jgi:hypothetical protein